MPYILSFDSVSDLPPVGRSHLPARLQTHALGDLGHGAVDSDGSETRLVDERVCHSNESNEDYRRASLCALVHDDVPPSLGLPHCVHPPNLCSP